MLTVIPVHIKPVARCAALALCMPDKAYYQVQIQLMLLDPQNDTYSHLDIATLLCKFLQSSS